MGQNEAHRSPALLRASFLVMGIAIIGTGTSTTRGVGQLLMNDTRSGQVMGDPTRPPNTNETRPPLKNDTRSGQERGEPTRPPHDTTPAQVMKDPTRPPHMNDTSHGQVMGDPTRVAKRTDGRSLEETLISMIPGVGGLFQLFSSPHLMGDPTRVAKRTDGRSLEATLISMIPGVGGLFQLFSSPHLMGDPTSVAKRTDGRSLEETLISMIPGVGGLFQLFSSPHLYGPIRTALRHLGKQDATEGINLHRTKRFAPQLTTEWNKIHGGTCETDKACSVISMCTEDNTCYPQGRSMLGAVAVLILICSGISACICCPCRGLMGC
jgi:hypothetical protein